MSRERALYLIQEFKDFIDYKNQQLPLVIRELQQVGLSPDSRKKAKEVLEMLSYNIKEYLLILSDAGFQSHAIKHLNKAIVECELLIDQASKYQIKKIENWFGYIEDGLNAIISILSVLEKPVPRAHGWLLDQLKRDECYHLIFHRLGSTRWIWAKSGTQRRLERDVEAANDIARSVAMHQKNFLRTVQVSMDCDLFWIEHKGRTSLYFGHPKGIRNIITAKKSKHFMPLRGKSGMEMPRLIYKKMDPHLYMNVELKFGVGDSWQAVKTLIDELRDYHLLQRTTFQSQNLYLLDLVKRYSHKLPTLLFTKGKSLFKHHRFHFFTHFTWSELFEKPAHISIPSLPSYVDGLMEHRPPKDILEYKAYVDTFRKYGKLCMPYVINAFMGTQHGKSAKRRILQGYLAGCPGGFIERSSAGPLLDFMKEPL